MPVGAAVVVGRDHRVGRLGHAAVGDRAELVLVDRPLQGLTEPPVLEDGVAKRGATRVAVEAQLVVAVDVHGPDLHALRMGELVHLRLQQAEAAVDRARLHVLAHGVGVGVLLEDDLVDVRRAAPVALVGLHDEVVRLLPLHALERAAAHDRRRIGVDAGGRLGRDLRPDMLGQDGHLG